MIIYLKFQLQVPNFNKAWHHKFILGSDSSTTEVDEPKNKKKLSSHAQKAINFNMDLTDSEPDEEGKL